MPTAFAVPGEKFQPALEAFADAVAAKFAALAHGEPEDQLRSPVETLLAAFSGLTRGDLVLKGESLLAGRLGRPDFALHAGITPIGYIELKAPGKGANPDRFSGHDRRQWEKFKNVPNLLYADGNTWALYRLGERTGAVVTLGGDITANGKAALSANAAAALFELLAAFVSWTPIVPKKPSEIAAFLAPYCRLLRDEVTEALADADPESPMYRLKAEIKDLLFPEASDEQFADAYAQTVLFALLLARMEGADTLDLNHACEMLNQEHLLLSRSLQFLTDPAIRKEIEVALDMIRRVVAAIAPETLRAKSAKDDPWLFFYEQFLAAYDPALRKDAGAYYTPLEVVRCQVRLVDELLKTEFKIRDGFYDPHVATLDPAVGTGTYLLGIVEHVVPQAEDYYGEGIVGGVARRLAKNLHGFEWLVGPYAVAQLRVVQSLKTWIEDPVKIESKLYLTNTLESPYTQSPVPSLFHEPIAREHRRALEVKDRVPILVCIGNPPYDRHAATDDKSATGGWVRHGDGAFEDGSRFRWINRDGSRQKAPALLEDFIAPVRKAGLGVHLKNLYNLYVYFIRWSLWKTFEHELAADTGVVSFITASSYLDGDAFIGLREHMRRICDRIDIIDLGGEGRGTRQDENVFAIQTPVCIFIASRKAKRAKDARPAEVRYVRIEGTRKEKLAALGAVTRADELAWKKVSSDWQAPFKPEGRGKFFKWPLLTDIMPWQHSGAQIKRTWPVAPDANTLRARWKALVRSPQKAAMFKESRDRKITVLYPNLMNPKERLIALENAGDGDMLEPVPYGYRSFDRQWIFPDNRVGDFLRPVLWPVDEKRGPLFFASLLSSPLGGGPGMTVSAHIPDMDYFRGSYGAKAALPLYRDKYGMEFNVSEPLLELLARKFKLTVEPKALAPDLAAYLYAVLAQPDYTARFRIELERCELRVPLTRDQELFFKLAEFGKRLIWLHTFGERFADSAAGRTEKHVPRGKARVIKEVPADAESYPESFQWSEPRLRVGKGMLNNVSREVYEFEVSGLKVVQSWLGYRMKNRKGKKSSPLDDIRPECWTSEFTNELLKLLWVLEATVAGYPAQAALLDELLAGPLFTADELPPVPDAARKPPAAAAEDDDINTLRDAAQPCLEL